MKSEWVGQSSCQYHTQETTRPSASTSEILTHTSNQSPMIEGTDSVSAPAMGLPSPQSLQNPTYMGMYNTGQPSAAATGSCTCSQSQSSQTNNILHSILTGQGHKVGYHNVENRELGGGFNSYSLIAPYRQSMVLTTTPAETHSERYVSEK